MIFALTWRDVPHMILAAFVRRDKPSQRCPHCGRTF